MCLGTGAFLIRSLALSEWINPSASQSVIQSSERWGQGGRNESRRLLWISSMRLGKASYLKDRMMCAVRLGREFSLKSMIHTAQTGPLQRPCKTPSVE